MIKGIESFRKWFSGYESQYTIIGGTACDLLMSKEGLDFRATKDIDLVLIIESINADFGKRFWEYINTAGYEHRSKGTGNIQFYRFSKPSSIDCPGMIELFSKKPDAIQLPEDAVLSPIPIEENISSLSAILLNDDYYNFLKAGRINVDGITILSAEYLIPFKAKAFLELSERKEKGEQIDSKDIRKHKNDIFRLSELLNSKNTIFTEIPETIKSDMQAFCSKMIPEKIDLKQIGIFSKTKNSILEDLLKIYLK